MQPFLFFFCFSSVFAPFFAKIHLESLAKIQRREKHDKMQKKSAKNRQKIGHNLTEFCSRLTANKVLIVPREKIQKHSEFSNF